MYSLSLPMRYNTDENRTATQYKCAAAVASVACAGTRLCMGDFDLTTIGTLAGATLGIGIATVDLLSYGNLPQIKGQKIKNGHGEFIVFRKKEYGHLGQIDKDTYSKIYNTFNEYSLLGIAKTYEDNEDILETCKNRMNLIKQEVKKIDKTLKVAFIPRTLYDMVLLNKCIREDINNENTACPLLDQPRWGKMEKTREKCWHVNFFPNQGNNDSQEVLDAAFRLNKSIAKHIFKDKKSLNFEKLMDAANKEIEFLRNFSKTNEIVDVDHINRNQGPSYRFHHDARSEHMHLKNERLVQIIRNAVAFECSEMAQTSLPLYRSAALKYDNTHWGEKAHSLSYGTSLLAGVMYDSGATTLAYSRDTSNDTFILTVPVNEYKLSPFFIPETNAICQFTAYGENFHGRSKAWKDFKIENLHSMGVLGDDRYGDHLKSELTEVDLDLQFEKIKSQAFILAKAETSPINYAAGLL